MSRRERCPECSEFITIPESHFGRTIICPQCRETIVAPPAELPDPHSPQLLMSELVPPPPQLLNPELNPLPSIRSEARRRKFGRMREFGFLLVLGGVSFAIVANVVFFVFKDFLGEAATGIAQGCIGLGGAISMGGLVLYTWCRAEAWRMSEID